MDSPVVEPPSTQLGSLLTRLGLASARDLRRCRPIVRRLARDLPTFDSVWIDALKQTRVITNFQARILESDNPERLEVGPCVLVDELDRDGRWTLCVARHRGTRRKCLLTYVHVPSDAVPRARDDLRSHISSLRGLSHPSIIVPQGCDEVDGRLVVVSPFTSGPTLRQLLVRRGRFPIPVVQEIARQLLDALAALDQCSTCHGDLRLNAVRLTSRGQTILLNAGVQPAIGTRVSFHDGLSCDHYDGTAPELISTGATANATSDLYALGCLLWQLLAGRPPYPTADPLGKLAAHQSRPIEDVRRWRPDTPPQLADVITRLTAKNPQSRPASPREARDTLRVGLRTNRSRLSSFHASFGAVAPTHGNIHRSPSRFPWTLAASLLVIMSGVSLSLLDAGARNELLRLANRVSAPTSVVQTDNDFRPTTGDSTEQSRPLPTTPDEGVIELQADATYLARDIITDRPLEIRCPGGRATILVGEQPLRITATSLQLKGIRFLGEDETDTGSSPVAAEQSGSLILLALRTQQLSIERCQFAGTQGPRIGTAIAWKIPDEADPSGGRFVARSCTFTGPVRALDLHAMPRVIGFDNCLKRGNGPLVRLTSENRSTPLRVHLRQTTLRESGSLLQWNAVAARGRIQPALIVVENSVISPKDPATGVLDFLETPPTGWERLLQMTGEGSLLRPEIPLVTCPSSAVDASSLRVEGLIIDSFEFASDDRQDASSIVVATQAPRSTATPPGVDPSHFAPPADPPVVQQAAHEYNAD